MSALSGNSQQALLVCSTSLGCLAPCRSTVHKISLNDARYDYLKDLPELG